MAVTVTRMEPMEAVTPRPRAAWIGGRPEPGEETAPVRHAYDGTEVATVSLPSAAQVERAVAGAARFAGETRSVPAHARAAVLDRLARAVESRADEFAELLTAEAAAPLTLAATEVRLAVATLRHAARFAGETSSRAHLDGPDAPGHPDRRAVRVTRQVPRGVALGLVSPHRALASTSVAVGAALAVGTPVVLVPTPRAALSTLALAETLADVLATTALPAGVFSVLPARAPDLLVGDPRLCPITTPAGRSRVTVLPDWPDVSDAAAAVAASVVDWEGRSHLPVRDVVVHATSAERFVEALTAALSAHRVGDPYDAAVTVGALPDEDAARRTLAWVTEARSRGADVPLGGERTGTVVHPTLVTGLPVEALPERVALGPVVTVSVADTLDTALAAGLCPPGPAPRAVGVFTRDLDLAQHAAERTTAGQVVVGDVPRRRPGDVRDAARALRREVVTVLAVGGRP